MQDPAEARLPVVAADRVEDGGAEAPAAATARALALAVHLHFRTARKAVIRVCFAIDAANRVILLSADAAIRTAGRAAAAAAAAAGAH